MHLGLPELLKTSIQAKVSAVVVAAVLSAVTLTVLTSALREADKQFVSKRAELEGIAAALSAGVSYPLAQRNTADVGRTLTAMRNIPAITFAQVIDTNGLSVVQFGNSIVLERPDQRVSPNTEMGLFSTLFLRNYIVEKPIVNSGKQIGTLRIIANITSLESALAESMFSALFAGAIAAALGLLLAQRLQRTITAPINRLTAAIQDIRSSQNFELAVERTSKDETGQMVDAFNDMLGQIRARDQRLVQHRDRLEHEVEERTSELKEATVAAQSANAAKSEFLATMSHEIRTPLNGMLVMAELLSTGDLPDRMQRHADVIVSSGQSLLAIINDILDLSKIEAGRLELEKIPVEPATVADQVMSLFAARAASKGIDLACYVTPSVPARIAADPVRLNQILANLVNNALKFTEQGSVTLKIEAEGNGPRSWLPLPAALQRHRYRDRHPRRQTTGYLRSLLAGRSIHHAAIWRHGYRVVDLEEARYCHGRRNLGFKRGRQGLDFQLHDFDRGGRSATVLWQLLDQLREPRSSCCLPLRRAPCSLRLSVTVATNRLRLMMPHSMLQQLARRAWSSPIPMPSPDGNLCRARLTVRASYSSPNSATSRPEQ